MRCRTPRRVRIAVMRENRARIAALVGLALEPYRDRIINARRYAKRSRNETR